MITGKTAGTPSKAILPCFFLGNYSATDEKMALDMRLGAQVIEWGNVDRWAVANPIADGRLLTVGALRTKRACGPAPLAAADFGVGVCRLAQSARAVQEHPPLARESLRRVRRQRGVARAGAATRPRHRHTRKSRPLPIEPASECAELSCTCNHESVCVLLTDQPSRCGVRPASRADACEPAHRAAPSRRHRQVLAGASRARRIARR